MSKKTRFLLSPGKKYNLWSLFSIPFVIKPGASTIRALNVIISALIPSLQAVFIAQFIDTTTSVYRGEAKMESIYFPLFLLALYLVYGNVSTVIDNFANLRLEIGLTRELRSAIADKRARLEYCHLENKESRDLISRVCEDPVYQIQTGFSILGDGANLLIHIFSLLGLLAFQVWWAGLAVFFAMIPLLFLGLRAGKTTYQANQQAQRYSRRARYLRSVLQSREASQERTIFGYTEKVNRDWLESFELSRITATRMDIKNDIWIQGSNLLTLLFSSLIVIVLLFLLSNGEISIGMFTGLATGMLNLVDSIGWRISYVAKTLASTKGYLQDFSDFCALSETEGALDMPEWSKEFESIEFRHVSFCYPGTKRRILNDFNLIIHKNLHYAFVGVNGAGKTTITKLLTGLYTQFEGDILIDGKSIRDYSQAQLKGLFSVVHQDFAKYAVTVRENLELGCGNCKLDEEKIWSVLRQIGLEDTIKALPQGLDTPLGKVIKGSVDLSGGQWQRLAIARLLCSPAQIRILDEPTASLDPVAESEVYELFGKAATGKSTIFITHRLGASRLADEIIVLSDGRVAEQGSHQALLNGNGIYAEMFESQRSWY